MVNKIHVAEHDVTDVKEYYPQKMIWVLPLKKYHHLNVS